MWRRSGDRAGIYPRHPARNRRCQVTTQLEELEMALKECLAVANKVFTADKYIKAWKSQADADPGQGDPGSRFLIELQGHRPRLGSMSRWRWGVRAEVIGFRTPNLLLTPLPPCRIAPGATVRATGKYLTVGVGPVFWVGSWMVSANLRWQGSHWRQGGVSLENSPHPSGGPG